MTMASAPLETHYRVLLRTLAEGRVVPLLGAGVNRCGRPDGISWGRGRFLPDGAELAAYLAEYAAFPEAASTDLVRVSQYFAVMLGAGPLYEELRELFDVDYPPTPVHELLAAIPGELRRQDKLAQHQLIITTNYDDALERAFAEAGELFDLVSYVALGEHAGSFRHVPPGGQPVVIEVPNEYAGLSLDERTVILKLHGAVDRRTPADDSFVITEDNYIDYLASTDLSCLLPVTLAAKLRRSHLLFLGYSLRDWNLRVILRRIWDEQPGRFRSWAVQLHPEDIDQRFWAAREVDIFDVPLEEYVGAVRERLAALPAVGVPS